MMSRLVITFLPRSKHLLISSISLCKGFLGSSDGKESACNVGDLGSIPGLGRSPGEGNGNHFSIIAWEIPWTEEPGRLQSMESQRVYVSLCNLSMFQ